MLKAHYTTYFFYNRFVLGAKTLCHSWCFNEKKNQNKKASFCRNKKTCDFVQEFISLFLLAVQINEINS